MVAPIASCWDEAEFKSTANQIIRHAIAVAVTPPLGRTPAWPTEKTAADHPFIATEPAPLDVANQFMFDISYRNSGATE
jgi:hypothetical protein